MILKNSQIWTRHNLCGVVPIEKVLKSNSNMKVESTPTHAPSHNSVTSSEIVQFLYIIHDNLFEIFPNFFYGLYVW